MKTTRMKKIMIGVGLLMSLSTFAQELPKLTQPRELSTGKYAEGTNTALDISDIQSIQAWAINAKKDLKEALEDAQIKPIVERTEFLENEIRRVVSTSGSKRYQALMRFALNRAMLLVDILEQEADASSVMGIIENKLDILERAIRVAIKFHESDLAYQRRVDAGDNAIRTDYAYFGVVLGKEFIQASKNIFDVSAQFRVLYKSFEMMAWDLYQDEDRNDYAELITRIHKNITRLGDGQASPNDKINVSKVRDLKYLLERVEQDDIYKVKFAE